MSELNYMIELLELKDNNIKFYENCYHKEKIKGIYYKNTNTKGEIEIPSLDVVSYLYKKNRY